MVSCFLGKGLYCFSGKINIIRVNYVEKCGSRQTGNLNLRVYGVLWVVCGGYVNIVL